MALETVTPWPVALDHFYIMRLSNQKRETTCKQVIKIPYEDSFIELPRAGHSELTELIPPYIEPRSQQQILHAFAHPVGTASLPEIAKGKHKVLIILENALSSRFLHRRQFSL